jgi:RNA polymerase sigma-70 factor (ECF subfamily)
VGTPPSDEELIRRIGAGDDEAFARLVDRHEGRTYNVCLRLTGNPDDAADAMQDTFLTVYRKLDRFHGDSRFSTWLYRVTVNACYDLLRKRRRAPMLHVVGDDEEPRPEPGPPTPDPADEIAGTADVAAALARIPEEFRAVLVLADVQDLAYEEISRILEVPVGTVKSRVHRGRVALAKALGLNEEPGGAPEASKEHP